MVLGVVLVTGLIAIPAMEQQADAVCKSKDNVVWPDSSAMKHQVKCGEDKKPKKNRS